MSEVYQGNATKLIAVLARAIEVKPDVEWELKEYTSPRSNRANRYFHRLVGLLAKGEKIAFFEKKNELITQYGNQEIERDKDGTPVVVYLPDNQDYKRDPVEHYKPTKYTCLFKPDGAAKGVELRAFLKYKGTHTYNSRDMAHLIDCTRNECLGCDIPMEQVETFEEKAFMQELRKRASAN